MHVLVLTFECCHVVVGFSKEAGCFVQASTAAAVTTKTLRFWSSSAEGCAGEGWRAEERLTRPSRERHIDEGCQVLMFARKVEASLNMMAHAQKQDVVFRRNGRAHLN